MSVKVIEVVETSLATRGDGKEIPIRTITQYWSREGELLAERDSFDATQNEMDKLRDFIQTHYAHETGRRNFWRDESAVDVALRLLGKGLEAVTSEK